MVISEVVDKKGFVCGQRIKVTKSLWYRKVAVDGEQMGTSDNGINIYNIDDGLTTTAAFKPDSPHASILILFITFTDIPVD